MTVTKTAPEIVDELAASGALARLDDKPARQPGNARLAEVTREAFATTRTQRERELRRVALREAVAMLRDGAPREDVSAFVLDSVLGEQAAIAGIRVPASFRVECACGYGTPGLTLAEADIASARHTDAECVPTVVVLDGLGNVLRTDRQP